MKNLKIGITIKLESVEDSMWTNGMKLNILMLINLLNNSENNYEVHLLNVKDISLENMPKHLEEANFGLLSEKYKDMDLDKKYYCTTCRTKKPIEKKREAPKSLPNKFKYKDEL